MTTTETTTKTTQSRYLDFNALDNIAIGACPGVLQHFAPHGKVRGSEWDAMCPTRQHKELGTFKFNFAGPRAGVWADFGAGVKGHGVIAYAKYCLGSASMREAAEEVADYLGIGSTSSDMPRPRPAPAPRPVQKPTADLVPFDPATPAPQIPRKDGRGFIETTASWLYQNAAGEGLFFIARTEFRGKKGFRQILRGADGDWKFDGLSGVTPLYKLPDMLARADAPVLFVEGEKTADAAAGLFPDFAVVTSRGGASNVSSTDIRQVRRDALCAPSASVATSGADLAPCCGPGSGWARYPVEAARIQHSAAHPAEPHLCRCLCVWPHRITDGD